MICIFFFREKIISCASFIISGLNDNFHWYVDCAVLRKFSLRFDDDITGLLIVEKSDVPSANNFALQRNPCVANH